MTTLKNILVNYFSHLAFLFSLFFFGGLSVLLGQDINWDLLNYHFYNPYAFLNNRLTYDLAPAQIQTFLNPFLDVPFYLLVTSLPPVSVGFIYGAFQGLNFFLVYLIGQSVLPSENILNKKILSFVLAGLGVYAPGFMAELGTTFQDNIISIFVLLALFILIKEYKATETGKLSFGKIFISGFCLGLGVGFKLTALIYAIGFFISAFLLLAKKNKGILAQYMMLCLGAASGFVTSAGYWMCRLWTEYQSPLFPFYNKIFNSPYYDRSNFFDNAFIPKDLLSKFFLPFKFAVLNSYLVSEMKFRDIRFAVIYILLVVFLGAWAYRALKSHSLKNMHVFENKENRLSFFLVCFFLCSYIIWQLMFSIYRYLIPIELISPLVIFLLSYGLVKNPRKLTALLSVLFVFMVFAMVPLSWGRGQWSESYFGVEPPPVALEEESVVLIAGGDPIAYVVPFFPPNVQFIRIESNFLMLRKTSSNLYLRDMNDILEKNTKPVYFLASITRHSSIEDSLKLLESRDLYATRENCELFKSRFEVFILCRLEKR
ncbi:MAG: DUF2029 domain-containing protein [Deltaproteobacteria bacterium]|nr:DUF2029 domain-containing protein [Deltaproteobacteria bacterium]